MEFIIKYMSLCFHKARKISISLGDSKSWFLTLVVLGSIKVTCLRSDKMNGMFLTLRDPRKVCLLLNWVMYRAQIQIALIKITCFSPGWCGPVDWEPACEPKGRWFDSQSEHTPGLLARSPVEGAQEATTHWCFSPSLSLPSPLSTNK